MKIFSSSIRSHSVYCILIVFTCFLRCNTVCIWVCGRLQRVWVWLCTCMCVCACTLPCQFNTEKKKNGICEYSVHFKPHFYHDTIVLELCIEKNYNKIVCYFFCGLSCRRKTKRATKVSNFQCFLICVWQYISSFLLLLQTHSPNSNPIAMTPYFTDKTINTGHMPTRGQEGLRNLVESNQM